MGGRLFPDAQTCWIWIYPKFKWKMTLHIIRPSQTSSRSNPHFSYSQFRTSLKVFSLVSCNWAHLKHRPVVWAGIGEAGTIFGSEKYFFHSNDFKNKIYLLNNNWKSPYLRPFIILTEYWSSRYLSFFYSCLKYWYLRTVMENFIKFSNTQLV